MDQDELHLDFETRSEVSLKLVGSDVYARHPSTEVIIATWSLNRAPVKLWHKPDGIFPAELSEAILDPEVLVKAFNAPFEQGIITHVLKTPMPATRMHCVMVHAYSLGFAGDLAKVGERMGLPRDVLKLASGKKLISKFCSPRRKSASNPDKYWDWDNAPEKWAEFCEYGIRDTVSEIAVDDFCHQVWPMSDDERALWLLDRQINDRGVPIDIPLVDGARRVLAYEKSLLLDQIKMLTNLDNPNSRDQILEWIADMGVVLPDLTKGTVAEFLKNSEDSPTPEIRPIRKVLKLRQKASKSSTAKWGKIRASVGAGARLRNTLQMNGAQRTGRWAGRGFQVQNLPHFPINSLCSGYAKGPVDELELVLGAADVLTLGDGLLAHQVYPDVMGVLSGGLRQAITARKGYTLMASDLSSIESIVLAWVSDCQFKLDIILEGRDVYKVFAAKYFGILEAEVTAAQRKFSKPPELGNGYGLAHVGLIKYAAGMGVTLSAEEAKKMVNLYRAMYVEIVEAWAWLVSAVERVTQFGGVEKGCHVEIGRNSRFLWIKLPSGRFMFYDRPEMCEVTTPWGQKKQGFTYMGMNQYTNKWERVSTHGGKIIENLTQGIARDVLKLGMFEAKMEGFDIIMLVHDEIVTEVPLADKYLTVDLLNDCMTRGADWTKGIPLSAAGWAGERYRKD